MTVAAWAVANKATLAKAGKSPKEVTHAFSEARRVGHVKTARDFLGQGAV